ncbi:MAG: SDR family oxidoreductase [Syntrophobacteraceae bacterium]
MILLVLGANSDIAHAVAKVFAREERADVVLASRDLEMLEKRARDIEVRCQVKAQARYFDARDFESHAAFYAGLDPKPDGVLVAFGVLGEQSRSERDFQEARKVVETNYLGAVSILEIVAADFERRGSGFVIGISSVAGERGRQSNYIYGSAKGAFTVYLSGLRNRLRTRSKGIRVITVLPGFVRTKMTLGMNLPGLLTAEPDEVALDIYRAFKKGRDVVFIKRVWRWIMLIIRVIPESFFMRLKL